MGVPKFFRFISERYPCLSEVVKEYELPEFDNFYIDANGIIHNCSHPDDSVHFRISEEEIFKDIFHYLEVLFRLIKPKKLFFIAIDGVAPRAKMNQQRSRRFRTARDAERATKAAIEKGEKLPDTERFDSNCITPGTVFMEKLHRQLQYFIKKKISTEDLWQKPKIILSGHNVPGEGEHKIMDYIRYLRSQSDWDPNTRHCLHGLDADLIMLGLCTHEPHFSLLREEVKFGKQANKRKTNVEETKFFLLHLSLMRDYLDLEFQELKETLPFPYDIERIIDDWVLMGFLVGNDFIPHLPHFHIANNALFVLYKAYIAILPTLDGYINNCGSLNLTRFEKYLEKLAIIDFDNFRDISADLKYFESKTGKKFPGTGGIELDEMDAEILKMAQETNLAVGDSEEYDSDASSETDLRQEFKSYKADFYMNKLEYEKVDSEVLRDQAECYVRAIQWNLSYYYTGCPSWSWYYPHHYSPYVSDVKGFSALDIRFPPSKPFLPFQQLLAVLPAASKTIIPEPFQDLMTSPESPIIKFYPSDFETDLNGKQNEWEAVVLIPFIDENSLLTAMEPHYKDLTEDEKMRNSMKPMEMYQYTKESLGRCEAPEYFPPINDSHAMLTEIWSKDVALSPDKVVKGRLPGAVSGAFLGFPHLRGIAFTAHLRQLKVKVFDHPSRGDNMILDINEKEEEDTDKIANDLMGKIVFVGWPHIQRGKVVSVHTPQYQYRFEAGKVKKYNDKDMSYGIHSEELKRKYLTSLGINLHKVDIIVYVKTVGDVRYRFEGRTAILDYLWSKGSVPFPYQTTLKSAPLLDKDEEPVGAVKDLAEVFYTGREVFILEPGPHYGELGLVKGCNDNGLVEVEIEQKPDLDVSGLLELSNESDFKYYPGNVAAQRLGLGSHLFSRVTGSIFIQNVENEEKLNIGLGLKFTRQCEEVVGFTRREGNFWTYSEKTIALLNDYMGKFPELFEYLEKNQGNDVFFNTDVFPENGKEKITEIKEWLRAQPHTGAERRPTGAKLLTGTALKEAESRILTSDLNKILKRETVQINPSKIFIPSSNLGKVPPDPSTQTNLLDRVASVRRNHNIPLGMRGTVVGYDKPNGEYSLYDVILDEPVPGGRSLDCDQPRIYTLPAQAFINISQGRKCSEKPRVLPFRKMEFFPNNKDSNKLPYPSPSKESQNIHNIGNHKVKQLFDYVSSGQVTSPQENRNFLPANASKPSRADSEFQAMWNVLQSRPVPEETKLRPEEASSPVDSSVQEQTNALKKILKLSEAGSAQHPKPLMELRPQVQPPFFNMKGVSVPLLNNPPPLLNMKKFPPQLGLTYGTQPQSKTCGHSSCCSELDKLCKSKNILYPTFKYNRINSCGEVLCTVTFSTGDYGNVVGDACKMDTEAAENAACKAIRQILQQDEKRRSSSFSHIQTGTGYRLPFPAVRHPHPSTNPTPRLPVNSQSLGQLPSPPTQWCPGRSPGDRQQAPNRRHISQPNQNVAGRDGAEVRSRGSGRPHEQRRKPRIAAKFSNPINQTPPT